MSDLGQGEYIISVRADGAIQSLQKFEQATQNTANRVQTSGKQMMLTMTGLAASTSSLYFGFENLDKISVQLERSHLMVARAQEHVNKLQKEGKANTQEYSLAVQGLQLAKDREASQSNNMNQAEVQLGLTMVTMATVSIPAAITAIRGLNISTTAFLTTLDTLAPYLLIVVAAFAAWEGIVAPLVKQQTGLDLSIISNVGNLMKQKRAVDDSSLSFDGATGSIGSFSDSIGSSTGVVSSFGTAVGQSTGMVDDFQRSLDKLKTSTDSAGSSTTDFLRQITSRPAEKITNQISTIIDSIESAKNKLRLGVISQADFNIGFENSLLPEIKNTIDEMNTAGLSTSAFLKALKDTGTIGKDQFSQITDEVDKFNKSLDKANSKLDDFKKKREAEARSIAHGGGVSAAGTPYLTSLLLGIPFEDLIDPTKSAFHQATNQPWNVSMEAGKQDYWHPIGTDVSRISGGINTSRGGGINFGVADLAERHYAEGLNSVVFGSEVSHEWSGESSSGRLLGFGMSDAPSQKFLALRSSGLFQADLHFSAGENIDRAAQMYDLLISGISPEVLAEYGYSSHLPFLKGGGAAVQWTHNVSQKALGMNAGVRLNTPDYSMLRYLKAITSEGKAKLTAEGTRLGMTDRQVADILEGASTGNDIQSMLAYKDRVAAMSSGTV